MLRVMVYVKYENGKGIDLEVPAEVEASVLATMLAKALQQSEMFDYSLEAHPPGRRLNKNETLASVNAWSGSVLKLRQEKLQNKKLNSNQVASFVSADDSNKKYPLQYTKMWIGRMTDDVRRKEEAKYMVNLNNEKEGGTVSRKHAQIVVRNGKWVLIVNDKTRQRTTVNGQPLSMDDHVLSHHDTITFGKVTVKFHLPK